MRTVRLASQSLPVSGLLHLLVIYVVWGSTYLAIRVAVRGDTGFAPFTLGATRSGFGGLILMAMALARRERILPTRREALVLFLSGLLLWVFGNGLVNWSEQRVHSGFAALVVGSTPLWVAAMEAVLDRRLPSARAAAALLVGFGGLAVLTMPVLRGGERGDALAVLALIGATVSWGAGTLFYRRQPIELSPRASSGYQQLGGALGFGLLALLFDERHPPSFAMKDAWLACLYLTLAGSVLAFTSFLQAVKALPTRIVTTYAYVNPVVAILLGWAILHEPVTWWSLAGTLLILIGVGGVFAG